MKKLILVLICVLFAVSAASCKIIINKPGSESSSNEAGTTKDSETSADTKPDDGIVLADLDAIVARTERQNIPVSTLRYFMMDQYSSFLNQYYYYLSYFGLDYTAPLHDQMYDEESGTTWYDYFLSLGKSALEQYAKFAEMAKKENIQLDETDIAGIDEYLANIEADAAENNMSFEDYMSEFMGDGMTKERVKAAVELSRLGYKYYLKIYDGIEISEEVIENEYLTNIKDYALVSYYEAYVKAADDETNTDDEIAAAKAEANETALRFKVLVEGGKSFVEAYNEVFPAGEGEEPAVESELLVEGAANAASLSKLEFIFDENTKQGDINLYTDENGNIYIVQCAALPYKDTAHAVNVRHILLDSSVFKTEEEALAKAEELVAQIKASSDPKATFISLVSDNSTDPGSNTNGGLYENVCPGDMVTEFNNWCFDPERQEGDVGYVLTDYGYHVMYLDSFGGEIWHIDCENKLRDSEFEKLAEDIYASVQITYDEDLAGRITK